jgi:hypothetical protein
MNLYSRRGSADIENENMKGLPIRGQPLCVWCDAVRPQMRCAPTPTPSRVRGHPCEYLARTVKRKACYALFMPLS